MFGMYGSASKYRKSLVLMVLVALATILAISCGTREVEVVKEVEVEKVVEVVKEVEVDSLLHTPSPHPLHR